MTRVDVETARGELAQLLDACSDSDVVIERRGAPAGVLVSPARHEQLVAALEELEDVQAFDKAMAEGGSNVGWNDVEL